MTTTIAGPVHPALRRRLLAALGVGLAVGFAFVGFFTSALHDPRPDALPVGVVGSAPVAAGVRGQLAAAAPGGFEVHRYADARAARRAIHDQEVDAVYLPGSRHRELLVSGASGANAMSAVRLAFAAPAASRTPLRVLDVAPVPAHDARGISAFFLVAGTTLGSLVFAIVLFFAGGHAVTTPLRVRLAVIAAYSVTAGVVMALASDVVADGLGGAFAAVAAIAALLAAVVALTTTALVRWLGTAGVAVSSAFLMLFSLPATGGAVGPEFVPGLYRDVAPALPSHAALQAVRGAVYLGDGGTAGPVLILLGWAAAALAVQLVAHAVRRAPHPPATGSPLEPDMRGWARSLAG